MFPLEDKEVWIVALKEFNHWAILEEISLRQKSRDVRLKDWLDSILHFNGEILILRVHTFISMCKWIRTWIASACCREMIFRVLTGSRWLAVSFLFFSSSSSSFNLYFIFPLLRSLFISSSSRHFWDRSLKSQRGFIIIIFFVSLIRDFTSLYFHNFNIIFENLW